MRIDSPPHIPNLSDVLSMREPKEPKGRLEHVASLICWKRGIAYSRRGMPSRLYGDGATIILDVSLVMSEADRALPRRGPFKAYKLTVTPMKSALGWGKGGSFFHRPTTERKESKCFLPD